ncbi:MAG: hypothetical protein IKX58_02410 [Clostridia bacterium]|nr:hypothetical protein [Clostridia bacterium]
MERIMDLWLDFARSGNIRDYMRYAEAKRRRASLYNSVNTPSEAAASIESIAELPERG